MTEDALNSHKTSYDNRKYANIRTLSKLIRHNKNVNQNTKNNIKYKIPKITLSTK